MPPYTRTWPEVNNLLGSRDADEIDEASRETHVDLTERFSSILENVEADPWKLKRDALLVRDAVRYPWSMGHLRISGTTPSIGYGTNYVFPEGAPGILDVYMPILVPIGWNLRWVVFRLWKSPFATVTATVHKNFPDGLTAILGTAPAIAVAGVWENKLLEGGAITGEPAISGTALWAQIHMITSPVPGEEVRFQDMEVACEPVVP